MTHSHPHTHNHSHVHTPILLLGLGTLGSPTLQALITHPQLTHRPLTVLTRPPGPSPSPEKGEQERTLLSLNITPLYVDLAAGSTTTASLIAVFKDFHTVISCLGPGLGEAGSLAKVAAAAVAAGVKRFLFLPPGFGGDAQEVGRGVWSVVDEQLDVREVLAKQNSTEWAIICTGMVVSLLFEEDLGVVVVDDRSEGGHSYGAVRALGSWENRIAVTTATDVGRVVAEVVADEGVRNAVVVAVGETLTFERLADLVEEIRERRMGREVWGLEDLESELQEEKRDFWRGYRLVLARGKGVAWDEEGTFDKKKGLKMMGVEEWARKNVERDLKR